MSGMEHLVLFCHKFMPSATPPHGNIENCRLITEHCYFFLCCDWLCSFARHLPSGVWRLVLNSVIRLCQKSFSWLSLLCRYKSSDWRINKSFTFAMEYRCKHYRFVCFVFLWNWHHEFKSFHVSQAKAVKVYKSSLRGKRLYFLVFLSLIGCSMRSTRLLWGGFATVRAATCSIPTFPKQQAG